MNPTCNKYTLDIVVLKRPTALDKFADTIPKPKGAVPNFGLPKWKVMPLESKIPMVPGPAGAYNFTRRKLGEGLWIPAPDAEFNLNDPYCYEMKMSYDALHDKHLVPYFSRPKNVRYLIKAGLVTKNRDAKCSLRDYNMYRKYLRKLHCDSVKKELGKQTKWSIEDRAIQYAQEQANKDIERIKEREKLMKLRRAMIRSRQRAEKLKLQMQKEKQQKADERLRQLIERKREDQRLQRIKSEARAAFIKQKQDAAAEIRRKKITQTFVEWKNKERIRKRTRQMRLAQEREEKRRLLEQKWEEKQEFQKKQIEQEQFLLKCVEDQRKQFIKEYNEKVEKETERMKKLFENAKMFIKCYLARRRPENRERVCCKKYFNANEMALLHDQDKTNQLLESRRDKMKKLESTKDEKQEKDLKGQKDGKRRKGRKGGGGKKRRRRGKKEKPKEQIDESEEKPETETEPTSSSKTEVTDISSGSELDRCRCQIVKDTIKSLRI